MTNVLLHVLGYLAFAILFSIVVSAALATASTGLHRRLSGERLPPSQSIWGKTLMGFGGWFAASLAVLGIMLAPEARGLQLYAAVIFVGAAIGLALLWKAPVQAGLDRMDQLARGETPPDRGPAL